MLCSFFQLHFTSSRAYLSVFPLSNLPHTISLSLSLPLPGTTRRWSIYLVLRPFYSSFISVCVWCSFDAYKDGIMLFLHMILLLLLLLLWHYGEEHKKRKKKRNVSLNVVQIDNRDVAFVWESANSGYRPAPSSSIGLSDKTANQVNQTSRWLRKLLPWHLIGDHFFVCVSWLVKTSYMGCDVQHYRWCYIDILFISFYGLW